MKARVSFRNRLFHLLILCYSLVILLLDYIFPLGYAMGSLYIIVCIASSFVLASKRELYWVTCGCCVLIALGYLISPHSDNFSMALVNRALSLFTVLMGCIMGALFITVRTQERALDKQFKHAMEAAPNAIAIVDAQGKLVFANQQIQNVFGWRCDELLGKNIDILVPRHTRSQHQRYRQSFADERRPRAMGMGRDLYGLRKDGSEVPIEIGLNPIHTPQGLRIVSTIVDLTERYIAQQKLRDVNTRLQSKNAELEQFVYTVSHDLKAPLVSIAGFAKKLAMREELQVDPQSARYLERVLHNVDKMESLIKDLLDLSRISYRKLDIDTVDLNLCISNSLAVMEGMVRDAGAIISIEDRLSVVEGQENLLVQVFTNLISNAIKYHRDGVTPTVKIGIDSEDERQITLYVQDNAVGISPEHQDLVFELFERLEPDRCEGTGVGLAIVKMIVEKHQGSIWLDSEKGAGTRFYIQLSRAIQSDQYDDSAEEETYAA